MKVVLLIWMMVLSYLSANSQIDSLVIYHRTFCTDYGRLNNDVNRIKTFGTVVRFAIKDPDQIKAIFRELERFPPYKTHANDLGTYLLGGYAYEKGSEYLLFTISEYKRLTYKGKDLHYKNEFLDLLLGTKPPCYF
jgi:hypothetical protein